MDWLALDPPIRRRPGAPSRSATAPSRAGRAVIEAAQDGDAETRSTLSRGSVSSVRHRRGPEGVGPGRAHIEHWLEAEVEGFATGEVWYLGRPLIVTENDYCLDSSTATPASSCSGAGRWSPRFERGGTSPVSPTRLAAVDTVYAMTVHKSQGSQFDAVAVLLPSADSAS